MISYQDSDVPRVKIILVNKLTCTICGGPIRFNNTSGICRRNTACAEENTRKQYRDAYKRRRDRWRKESPETAPLTAEQYQKSRRRGICKIAGCGRPHSANGLCSSHRRLEKSGRPVDVEIPRRDRPRTLCRISTCTRFTEARGLCNGHYRRWCLGLRGAELEAPLRAMRRKGTGRINPEGYVIVGHDGKTARKHRLVMEREIGRKLYPFENVHHKNGRRADNRPENLELWTRAQPSGQRIEDLVAFVVDSYPSEVLDYLVRRKIGV